MSPSASSRAAKRSAARRREALLGAVATGVCRHYQIAAEELAWLERVADLQQRVERSCRDDLVQIALKS